MSFITMIILCLLVDIEYILLLNDMIFTSILIQPLTILHYSNVQAFLKGGKIEVLKFEKGKHSFTCMPLIITT